MEDIFYEDMVSYYDLFKSCPLCNKGVTITKEIDRTPGFREISYYLKEKLCTCNIKVDYSTGKIKEEK